MEQELVINVSRLEKKEISYERSFASHDKAMFWSDKNGDITPRQVSKGSDARYWFDCSKCNHSFNSRINKVTTGRWCPYCSHTKLCEDPTCDYCFTNSFASHSKSEFWGIENGDITPRQVSKRNENKFWFKCNVCEHTFNNRIKKITIGQWCPYCATSKLCTDKKCMSCFNNSFASHPRVGCWSKKNTEEPRNVFKSSSVKYLFDCNVCNHSFSSMLSNVSTGYWCPYCAHRKLCTDKECMFCFNNSFGSHPKVAYWSKKNIEEPRNVFKSCNKKVVFDCDKCMREFYSTLINVSNGRWCSYCKNKTETKLYRPMKEIYPSLLHQFKQDWCKKSRCLPFDFCIIEHKIIIELDGKQHFDQVGNWKSPETIHATDVYKEKCANDNGYSTIRILQVDVWDDKYDWVSRLQKEIKYIVQHDTVIHNIYIGDNGEYDKFTENTT